MKRQRIKPFNVIDNKELSEIFVEKALTDGDPLEINGEMYYVCEQEFKSPSGSLSVGVIPLVVRDPKAVKNIKGYIECLSIAHKKVQYKNDKGICDFDNCNEMIIS
jgi:hypothetical protein